jgi:hypothetical protein
MAGLLNRLFLLYCNGDGSESDGRIAVCVFCKMGGGSEEQDEEGDNERMSDFCLLADKSGVKKEGE